MNDFARAKRIVIKVGTSSLTYDTGLINMRKIEALCKILSDIRNSGRELILVSSGAIAVGFSKLSLPNYPKDIAMRQACAAVGQCELMYFYDKIFKEYGQRTAQVLLTSEDMHENGRRTNIQNTFETLMRMNVIPIVNENDTVSTEEIGFGDNDRLSAYVALLSGAKGLVIMSDIDGLFDKNPQKYPDAKLIPLVSDINEDIEKMAGGVGSAHGTGGMATKIAAAKIATGAGCAMCIMNSRNVSGLYDLLEGKDVGTIFAPAKERI